MTSHIFIVYETTNLVNGRKYRGAHKGNVNDGYLGSGKILNQAIQKLCQKLVGYTTNL